MTNTKEGALASLQGQDYLNQVRALRFLEGLDRAENEGVVDALVAVFGTNYDQYEKDNKVRMLKIIGKHLKPDDPRAACAILKSINIDDEEVRQTALISLGRMNIAAGGLLSDKEVSAALASITYADDDFLRLVQPALQGTDLWLKLLRMGVINFSSNFALLQLRSEAPDLDWGKLCLELKQDSEAAATMCLRICRAKKFNKERAVQYLLPFLTNICNLFNFGTHLEGLRQFGCTDMELSDFLCRKMPAWIGKQHGADLWEPVWPVLEAAGEDRERAFLEVLVKNLTGENTSGPGPWERWYYELHEVLFEKGKYGFPARLEPALLSLLKKHAWPRRHNGRDCEPGYLTGKIFERRAEFNLSREELKKLITCEDAANSMVDAVKAAPEDPELAALAEVGLKHASIWKLCEAFAEWREELLPPPARRIKKIQEVYDGHVTSVMEKAWKRAVGKEYLLAHKPCVRGALAPAPTVLLICRTSAISLRFLLFMQPMPALDCAPLLPWLEQVCSDTTKRDGGPHWFVARTKAEKPDSDLSRSAPFPLAEAFAVELPAAALPFLLQGIAEV